MDKNLNSETFTCSNGWKGTLHALSNKGMILHFSPSITFNGKMSSGSHHVTNYYYSELILNTQ